MDTLHIKKVNEPRTLVDEMIAVGCRVVRGLNWKYGDHDGGVGTKGTVLNLNEEGKVVDRWDRKNVGIYKFGCNGLFKVKLCDDLSNSANSMPYEESKSSVHSGKRFRYTEPGKYRNTSETMFTNECDKEDYLIPLYSDTSVSAIWEYQKGSQWMKYLSGINVKIEKAYQRKKTGKIIIEMDRTTYIVNFSRMIQANANNKTEMAVRRKALETCAKNRNTISGGYKQVKGSNLSDHKFVEEKWQNECTYRNGCGKSVEGRELRDQHVLISYNAIIRSWLHQEIKTKKQEDNCKREISIGKENDKKISQKYRLAKQYSRFYVLFIKCEAWSSNSAAASNKIQQLEKHVQKVETQFLEDTSKLKEVTYQITNLLKKSGVVVEHYNIVSTASPTDITSQNTTSNTIGNKESRSILMDKIPSSTSESAVEEDNEFMTDDESCSSNTFERRIENDITNSVKDKTDKVIKHRVSNIVLDETFNVRIDTNSLKTVKSRNDNIVMTKASISDFENLHNKDDKENIKRDIFSEKDNPLIRISTKHSSNKNDGEKLSKQVLQTRTKIKENGYKSKSMESQHDNRVSYHSKHGCFEGTITTNVLNMDLQKEEFILPNIKPEEMLGFSQERLLDVDQPKTIREWLHYTNQMRAHASARMISGVVKLGRSQNVILVLDTSERMTGYFQKLKSTALQYVYGIKQQCDCTGMDNGIGLATFGRQTRLIQEATSDYDLIIELIGKLTPDGDAPVIGGLLMGFAGVVSCILGFSHDIAIQAHMIVFTDGSSGQDMPSVDADDNTFSFGTLRILEQAMRKTNGKIIQDYEIGRLTVMTQVMLLAISIASEIRYSNNQSREVIKRKMAEKSHYDDIHDDCLDMVQEFINPLRYKNMRGFYVELKCITLQLGDRVRRGPDWAYDDQDLGLPGTVIGQDFDDWIWVEWDHGHSFTYLYDEQMDRYQVRKVNEARILVNEMIAVGCRVVRGQDWKYDDYDGGEGSLGTVLEVKDESKVVVRWDGTNKGIFKIGHDGLFEVRLCDDFVNNERTIQHIKPNNQSHNGQQNYHNLKTTTEDDPLDYVIPIYSDTSVSAIWEYGKGSQWTQYPPEINTKIEKAYQRKQSGKIIFEMNYTTCIIDFQRMIQKTPQKKTELPVRRKD
ncbi:unnamed protein product [Mytilus coruscus]|uniref:MIB n=1 Tax=Mytilus coruscus TaxID=42192 RepID=A0A6J8B2Q6_MYTCO|nr:unnamed protein product [Mytilus coruscus]